MRKRKRLSKLRLVLEELECRLTPTGSVTVALDPALDQFGDQVGTVQAYGDGSRATFGIFDTGASAVTFSPDDQDLFSFSGDAIPIKVPGGAGAGGIGGQISGDVSQPGTILAAGMHAETITFDSLGFPDFTANFDATAASTPGIQTFVGTADGSPDLPTITGTPILHPSATNPAGLAAKIDLQGTSIDFSALIPGLILTQPDLNFVAPGTRLQGGPGLTDPVYIPLGTFGSDTYANPGTAITESPSPMQNDVSVFYTPLAGTPTEADHNHFLLDTGSQLTIISPEVAASLGLDLNHPDSSIDVQGVAGTETVPGFTLSKLELHTTDAGTVLDFTNVPVYVLEVAPGVDGLLGMNLFDTASSMLYDPYNPGGATLGLTFYTDPNRGLDDSTQLTLALLAPSSSTLLGYRSGGLTLLPTATFSSVSPAVRSSAVNSLNLTFTEPVTGLALSDLQLTRNGVQVNLAGATLTSAKDETHWTLGNLSGLTAAAGAYQVKLVSAALRCRITPAMRLWAQPRLPGPWTPWRRRSPLPLPRAVTRPIINPPCRRPLRTTPGAAGWRACSFNTVPTAAPTGKTLAHRPRLLPIPLPLRRHSQTAITWPGPSRRMWPATAPRPRPFPSGS